MLLAAIIVGIMHGRSHRKGYVVAFSHAIASELLVETNSAKLTQIGTGLRVELADLLSSPSGIEDVRLGDAPLGDGRACSHVILSNAVGKRLGIRLRADANPEKFHVLGFWNLGK